VHGAATGEIPLPHRGVRSSLRCGAPHRDLRRAYLAGMLFIIMLRIKYEKINKNRLAGRKA